MGVWTERTRLPCEVVGQLLDYAANGVVYWPLEQLRELFARQCERDNRDPENMVAEVAGDEVDVEEFWEPASENLRAGKLRMVFVSDEIPRELRRVIEFRPTPAGHLRKASAPRDRSRSSGTQRSRSILPVTPSPSGPITKAATLRASARRASRPRSSTTAVRFCTRSSTRLGRASGATHTRAQS
jgi:hypothetical protein